MRLDGCDGTLDACGRGLFHTEKVHEAIAPALADWPAASDAGLAIGAQALTSRRSINPAGRGFLSDVSEFRYSAAAILERSAGIEPAVISQPTSGSVSVCRLRAAWSSASREDRPWRSRLCSASRKGISRPVLGDGRLPKLLGSCGGRLAAAGLEKSRVRCR